MAGCVFAIAGRSRQWGSCLPGVRVEVVDVVGRIFERLLGRFLPEEIVIDARDYAVALEALRVTERCVLECAGAIALGVQCLDLAVDRGGTPVRHLPVELVAAG